MGRHGPRGNNRVPFPRSCLRVVVDKAIPLPRGIVQREVIHHEAQLEGSGGAITVSRSI